MAEDAITDEVADLNELKRLRLGQRPASKETLPADPHL
jgi:hypothetical protein